jgi:predicted amidophosphoribosyltransferase
MADDNDRDRRHLKDVSVHRRIDVCMNCQKELPIAAHGLCWTCYRREQRAAKRIHDPHEGGLRKTHQKIVRAYAKLMSALIDLQASRADIAEVKRTLAIYLEPIRELLQLDKEDDKGPSDEGA